MADGDGSALPGGALPPPPSGAIEKNPQHAARGGLGRACIGLGLSGQGLGILTGIVPHEDLVVGVGLLSFGAVLLATGRLPCYPWLRRSHLAWAGLAMLGIVAGGWLWTGLAPTGPKVILVVLGIAALAAAAAHRPGLTLPGGRLRPGDAVANAAIAIVAPLGVWLVQAGFKQAAGTTPLEAFMVAFLVVPVHWILGGLGLPSQVQGQTLTLAGPSGPMPVEIGVACSGIQAMAVFLMILGVFAALERPPGRRLAAWAAVGLLGVYATNLVRLVVVLLAGHRWGPETLERVHAEAGWLFFVAWTLLFAWWVRRGLRQPGTA